MELGNRLGLAPEVLEPTRFQITLPGVGSSTLVEMNTRRPAVAAQATFVLLAVRAIAEETRTADGVRRSVPYPQPLPPKSPQVFVLPVSGPPPMATKSPQPGVVPDVVNSGHPKTDAPPQSWVLQMCREPSKIVPDAAGSAMIGT